MSFRLATQPLRRAVLTPAIRVPHLAASRSLSSTAVQQANVRQAFTKKKKGGIVRAHKKMAPGEALAAKRRVSLTNSNAIAVPLDEFSSQTLEHPDAVGTMYDFSLKSVEKMKALGLFWPKRNWEMWKRPVSLVREETMEIGKLMRWVETGEGDGKGMGKVNKEQRWAARAITGKKKAGKSLLMMQAAAYALERGWVVISVPEARDLVISHTAYELDRQSGLWLQKNYVQELMERMMNANPALKKMPVTLPTPATNNVVPKGLSIAQLIESALDDHTIATEVFSHILKELSQPGAPPVLFTYDNLAQICQLTKYRDPDFNLIHGFDFALSKLLLDLLNLRTGIGKSVTLAATSLSTPPKMRSVDVGLYKITPDPYEKLDFRVVDELSAVQTINVGNLSQAHGRTIMNYVRDTGLLVIEPECGIEGQDQFIEKYAVSGGVTGEFVETILAPKVML